MPKLTDALARNAQVPAGKRDVKIYDDQVSGFGLRVTATGTKSFMLNYVVAGRERRITIGKYPAWSVSAAREQAAKLRRRADAGEDPAEERASERAQKTVRELFDRYVREVGAAKAINTQRDENSVWTAIILPELGSKRVKDVTFSDVERLHRAVSVRAPTRANRCLALLRHAFRKAIQWKWTEHNPVVGVKSNPEQPRDRHLSLAELAALHKALDARADTPSILAIKFILLTGCRKGEALNATWSQIDSETATWTKPSSHTKQRRIHRVPLSTAASEVLERARKFEKSEFLFPSKGGQPLTDIKKAFASILADAGIQNFRMHDLRHSFASILASSGADLQVVGKLLGHTQTATTMRYAHYFDDTLRKATELMSEATRGKG